MGEFCMSTISDNTARNLRQFNLVMGIIHLIQGVVMLAISDLDFKLPVTTAFLEYNEASDQLVSKLETAFKLPLAPMVVAFLFLSSFAHFSIVSPGIFSRYIRNLQKGTNYARWVEYAFSSSIMIVAIAMLFGMYDMATLLLIFALNAMMILFGWMMELHNQTTEKTDWTAFIFGSIAGIVPWIAIGIYFVGSVTSGEQVPAFVYAIYVSLFVFFNIFAVNMVLQYKKVGPWQNYIFGEKMYIVLSLVAKSLLAWQVFFGTLQPN
ncbi:MAG: heliorhodopsin HeR [Anaerolineae bacterium]|nr:heliorhodopsin HeR [Anaerolineae bacterium]